MVRKLRREGYIHSEALARAMRKVRREAFMPNQYVEYAYAPYSAYPIPPYTGNHTISAPNTYPLFYEPLKVKPGDSCLEVGTGSGYGAALLQELVGEEGKVVSIEANRETYDFGKKNLEDVTYTQVKVVHGDGTKGYPPDAPFDKIVVTASYVRIPQPLKEQLARPGKLIMPVGRSHLQYLTLLEKDADGNVREEVLDSVLYVPLRGEYGYQ
ncbi:MAG: protein-L-isoaspartate O-methyltransferase [Candidatus Korarchaeota archaeon]|nr:protein-L-isoaspartate O-methyltransferase [Candidatus Korarchaeota archaeon]NIU82617.1 protein-L-isoaspartate O-methyltransferase [Candidatus Thorarchaeota archaeon]NIW13102.1 protein-L-isoaspartate O-methyltransferase [Candidatus Thorarchaeota archaeon]NIW51270.1 protein-L-isoaspartate O-methyltransferase [Candidatus Korarchaeota archaeon]